MSKKKPVLPLPLLLITNPMPGPTGGAQNWKFFGNGVDLLLEIDQVCDKAPSLIFPIVAHALEIDVDSALKDPKILTSAR